jgi:hypothetical protein
VLVRAQAASAASTVGAPRRQTETMLQGI